jgi:fatty acid desaturase
MHVTTAATVIGVLQIIGCIITLISDIVNFSKYDVDTATFAIAIVFVILQLIFAALMLYGISSMRHYLILPNVVFGVIGLIGLAVGCILAIVGIAKSSDIVSKYHNKFSIDCSQYDCQEAVNLFFGILLGAFIVALIFDAWFFAEILRCYQFVKAKSFWMKHNAGHQHQQQQVGYGVPVFNVTSNAKN